MSKRTESNFYTVLFALGMVVVVGSLLAFAAESLKDTITENKRIEKQQNILYAMGVNENEGNSAVFVSKDKVGRPRGILSQACTKSRKTKNRMQRVIFFFINNSSLYRHDFACT